MQQSTGGYASVGWQKGKRLPLYGRETCTWKELVLFVIKSYLPHL